MDLHKGFICAMRFAEGKLFSGAKDGKVHMIDTGTHQVLKTSEFPSLVRAIDCNGGSLIVGQRDGTISVRSQDESQVDIMKSHSDGEVWGLADCGNGQIVTSGDDNKVMFWDPSSRTH